MDEKKITDLDHSVATNEAESIATRWIPRHATQRQGLVSDIAASLLNARELVHDMYADHAVELQSLRDELAAYTADANQAAQQRDEMRTERDEARARLGEAERLLRRCTPDYSCTGAKDTERSIRAFLAALKSPVPPPPVDASLVWDTVRTNAAEVATWPQWKRDGSGLTGVTAPPPPDEAKPPENPCNWPEHATWPPHGQSAPPPEKRKVRDSLTGEPYDAPSMLPVPEKREPICVDCGETNGGNGQHDYAHPFRSRKHGERCQDGTESCATWCAKFGAATREAVPEKRETHAFVSTPYDSVCSADVGIDNEFVPCAQPDGPPNHPARAEKHEPVLGKSVGGQTICTVCKRFPFDTATHPATPDHGERVLAEDEAEKAFATPDGRLALLELGEDGTRGLIEALKAEVTGLRSDVADAWREMVEKRIAAVEEWRKSMEAAKPSETPQRAGEGLPLGHRWADSGINGRWQCAVCLKSEAAHAAPAKEPTK